MSLPWWAIVIIVVVALALLYPFLRFIRSVLVGVKTVFKVIWWIISLPFRGIRALIRRKKENDGGSLSESLSESSSEDPSENPPDSTGSIYKTTDGFLSGRPHIKKPRRIAVIEQRKDDGAVASVKIYSLDGKESEFKEGKNYIPDLVLSPEEHTALSEDSIVDRKVVFGIKQKDGKPPKSIFPRELEDTGDKLTDKELQQIQDEVQNYCPKNRETYEKNLAKWRKHFK